jgi:membrane protein DedA with SNARE-associated domain
MEEFGQLIAGLEQFVRDYGVFAVSLILAIEAIGAPVPGETLLIFSSVLVGRGEMSLSALLVFAWIGSVLGDNIGYAVGRYFGRGVVSRYGTKVGLDEARINAIENIFLRYGSVTILFARFVNILRQLNGIVAGILRMPWQRFLLFNMLGGALWVAAWVFAASFLTEHISIITKIAHHGRVVAVFLAIGILIVALGLLVWRLRRAGGHYSD